MKNTIYSVLSWLMVAVGLALGATTSAFASTFPASLVGNYQAQLVGATSPTIPAGTIDVAVASSGIASGRINLPGGKSYPFKTTPLSVDGNPASSAYVTNFVAQKGPFPAGIQNVQMNLRVYPSGQVTGVVVGIKVNGIFSMANGMKFATFTAASPAPWTGTYTMAMTPAEGSGAGVPAGAGYATLAVAPNGNLVSKFVLGDGTKLTNNAKPTADAKYRLYSSLYTSGGFVSTVVDLDALGLQPEDALWNKPANAKDKKYKDGFSAVLDVHVREWAKLSSVKIPAGFTVSKNFAVDFSGQGLSDTDFATTLPDTARFISTGAIQAVAGGANAPADNNSKEWNKLWNVKVNPVTGEFTGTQVLKTTVGSKTTSKTIKVAGVLLVDGSVGEDEIFALGQYAVTPAGGTEITGLVSFSGPLEDNPLLSAAGTYKVTLVKTSGPLADPAKVPANGEVVTFAFSEDLSTVVITHKNGPKIVKRTVPRQGGGAGFLTTLVFSDAPRSPFNYVFATFTFGPTGKLGLVQLSYGGGQSATFLATDDGDDGVIAKQP